MRLTADAPGKIAVSTWIDRQQDAVTHVVGHDRLNLVGALGGGKGLSFLAAVKILAEGGRLDPFPERIVAENVDAMTIVVAAATSYRGLDHRAAVENALSAAAAIPYERLKADHVADHQRLFRRVTLALGSPHHPDAVDAMPTDERLDRVKRGEKDLGLDALYFHFGRYLLIASSRPGGLPANLQGLWNDSMFPPWNSDYHLNINLQMNYWPAEVTNLAELHQPLFDYVESLREPGPQDREDPLRRRRLRRASHLRRVGLHDSRRPTARGPVADRRRMADAAFVGALSVQPRSRAFWRARIPS